MSGEDGLPPLREVIERHGLAAKKSLGQNFLFDLNLTRRIARAAAPFDNCTVIEIGPGPGGLTRALLMEGAPRVIAVERDDRALAALAEIEAAYPGRLTVIAGDAMTVDWSTLVKGPAKIVANLPYNIGTPLLTGWLTTGEWPPWYASLTLMFQKEVAERIAAKPGSDHFGRLSVLCQWRCQVHKLFDVHRSAFTPPVLLERYLAAAESVMQTWRPLQYSAPFLALAIWFAGTAWLWRKRESPVVFAASNTEHVSCPQCSYNLKGLKEVHCPECGWTSTVDQIVKLAFENAAAD